MREQDIFENKPKATYKQKNNIEYVDSLHWKFGQLIREQIPEESSDFEELFLSGAETQVIPPDRFKRIYDMAVNREKKRRKKVLHIASILIIALTASVFTITVIVRTPSFAKTFKAFSVFYGGIFNNKIEKKYNSDLLDSITGTFNNWNKVNRAKKVHEELYLPNYLPEGYTFDELITIDDWYNFYVVWKFSDDENNLLVITQYGGNYPVIVSTILPEKELEKIKDGLVQ